MNFKLKDIETALKLILAFKNADWVEEHLKALLEAKAVADKAIAEQKSIQAGNDASLKALEALMADHKRQEMSLADRELRLKDAEQQHQFKMQQDKASLAAQGASLDARFEAMNTEHARQCELRAAESASLDKREKELKKREAELEHQIGVLEEHRAAFNAEAKAHADKVRQLRELTA